MAIETSRNAVPTGMNFAPQWLHSIIKSVWGTPKSCLPTTRFRIPVLQTGQMLIQDNAEEYLQHRYRQVLPGGSWLEAICQVHGGRRRMAFRGRCILPVEDLGWFGNTGTCQHFGYHRNSGFTVHAGGAVQESVEPFQDPFRSVPGSCEGETPGGFSIETLHGHPDEFTGDHDTAPQERKPGYLSGNRLTGESEHLRRNGKILGCGHGLLS